MQCWIGVLIVLAANTGVMAQAPPLPRGTPTAELSIYDDLVGQELPPDEWRSRWLDWLADQSPWIGKDDLRDLLLSKRESIVGTKGQVRFEYLLQIDDQTARTGTIDWGHWRDRIRVQKATLREGSPQVLLRSYDGTHVRERLDRHEMPPSGYIRQLEDRSAMFERMLPRPMSGLTDSVAELGSEFVCFDLVAFVEASATRILADPAMVDGTSCLVVVMGQPARFVVFLDPDRDMSLVRYEEFEYKSSPAGVPVVRTLVARRDLRNLEHLGNGVWVPRHVTSKWFATDRHAGTTPGSVIEHLDCEVLSVTLNVPLDDAYFGEVFEPGLFVWDTVRNLTYRHGAQATVEDALATTVSNVGARDGEDGSDDGLRRRASTVLDLAIAAAAAIMIVIGMRRMR